VDHLSYIGIVNYDIRAFQRRIGCIPATSR